MTSVSFTMLHSKEFSWASIVSFIHKHDYLNPDAPSVLEVIVFGRRIGFSFFALCMLHFNNDLTAHHYCSAGYCNQDNVIFTTGPKGCVHTLGKWFCFHSDPSSAFKFWWHGHL